MEDKAMETVNKTIEAMGEWIQKKLRQDERRVIENYSEVAEMAKALAELVSARKELNW